MSAAAEFVSKFVFKWDQNVHDSRNDDKARGPQVQLEYGSSKVSCPNPSLKPSALNIEMHQEQ